ncbi:MAG TPA: PAS domain-containing protein, partial [Microcoleaceae cyanobacterium]
MMSSAAVPPIAFEQILEKIADISLRIQQLSNLDEIFTCAVEQARAILSCDRVLIYQFAQTGLGVIRANSGVAVASLSSLVQWVEQFDCQPPYLTLYAQRQNHAVADIDTQELQPADLALAVRLQIAASFGVPIFLHDRVWGLLIAHQCRQARQWQSLDQQLLQQIALQLAIALQQHQFKADSEPRISYSPQPNELQHQSIANDQTEMIARFSSDNILLFVNEAYCRYFGVNREDMVGKSYQPVIYPPDQDIIAQQLQRLSAENPTITIENRVINAQGEIRWTQWVNRRLTHEPGGAVEFQTVGRDITDLKQTEIELRAVRDRLQYLLTYAPAVLFTCQPSGDYGATYVSSNITAMLGYEPQNFIENTRFWLDHIHPDDLEQVLQGIPQIFINNHHCHELRFLHANGSYRWLLEELTVIRDQAGQPIE